MDQFTPPRQQNSRKRGGSGLPSSGKNFPLRLEVAFKPLTDSASQPELAFGETIFVSSKAITFRTAEKVDAGQRLRVAVRWPARLEKQTALDLVVEGLVLTSEEGEVAVRFAKYEFRTRKSGQGLKTSAAGSGQSDQAA